jgi:hypothetical protein
MPIQFKCGNAACGKVLRVKDELAGKLVKCPACQTAVRIPQPAGTPMAAAPAAPRASAPPPPVPSAPSRRRADDESDEAQPPPKKRRRDEDKDEAPVARKRRRDEEDEEDEAPRAKKRRRDEEDEEDEGSRQKKGRRGGKPKPEYPPGEMWAKSEMLRHNRFMVKSKFSFSGVKFNITNPDTKDDLGMAKERIGFFTQILRGVNVGPVRFKDWMATIIEVREEDDGPVLFTIRKPTQLFSLVTTLQVLDDQGDMIGYFRTKLFSFFGGFWVYDAHDEKLAEVQAKFELKNPRILFKGKNGSELAHISSEVREAKGIKVVWGSPGLTVSMAEEMKEQTQIKVLLLATTLAMEMTGVGKKLVKPGG